MDNLRITRRRFLGSSAAALAGPYVVPSSVLGLAGRPAPSARLTMGAIGVGGQGTVDLRNFLACEDVRVLAVCDVDARRRHNAKGIVDAQYGNKDCAEYNDFRELLARDDVDTVLIATPDHWHAIISIAAAHRGKDLYCEKPISLTVAEGRAVVETMTRMGRVYQSGTQRRSIGCFRFAVDVARAGMIGKIHTIRTYLDKGIECAPEPPQPVPPGFDYDFWLGPAPDAPYTRRRCQGSFRWIYDYSGGQLTDIGAHFNDLAQWGNGTQLSGPIHYEGRARFPNAGIFNTPVEFQVMATYADGVKLVFHDTGPRAVKFEGDEGWVIVDDDGNVDAEPKSILRTRRIVKQDYANWQGHHRDFLDCVKRRGAPIAPPEVAHRSTTVCHIGNICLRLGRPLRWDLEAERFLDDDDANRMLARAMRSPWRL
jgi:predicted dehydrogenase